MIQSNKLSGLFYNNCGGKKLSTKRCYYTCLAKNTEKYPLYDLKEIENTRQYVGKFFRYYITGVSDDRCGHYEFLKDNNILYHKI